MGWRSRVDLLSSGNHESLQSVLSPRFPRSCSGTHDHGWCLVDVGVSQGQDAEIIDFSLRVNRHAGSNRGPQVRLPEDCPEVRLGEMWRCRMLRVFRSPRSSFPSSRQLRSEPIRVAISSSQVLASTPAFRGSRIGRAAGLCCRAKVANGLRRCCGLAQSEVRQADCHEWRPALLRPSRA